MRAGVLVWLCSVALGCGSEASPPVPVGTPGPTLTPDAGADAAADAGCGPSFDEAVAANPAERVCQTTVYDRVTGYCTHWVPCSEL